MSDRATSAGYDDVRNPQHVHHQDDPGACTEFCIEPVIDDHEFIDSLNDWQGEP